VEAATTNLLGTIDGEAFSLEADLTSDDLTLAPSSNNTCTVNDAAISGDPYWSKGIGEFGYWINVDAIGSEIESLTGTTQCFLINNGSATEVFLAEVDVDNTGAVNNRLIPTKRGVGGTNRIAFSNNDIITLLKAHYVFLDNDLATIDTTMTYPTWSNAEPSTPTTGDYWWDIVNKTWKRYSGVSWEALGRIYLGFSICNSADCLYVEHVDFNLSWNDLLVIDDVATNSVIQIKLMAPICCNVAGNLIKFNTDQIIDMTTNLEAGESETASTWYYIYLSKTGNFYLSSKAPRKYDDRFGWYHPQEYWRCVSFIFNDSVSDFFGLKHETSTGVFDLDTLEYKISCGTPGSGVYSTITLNSPIIVRDIEFDVLYSNTAGNTGDLLLREKARNYATTRICKQYACNITAAAVISLQTHYRVTYVRCSLIDAQYRNMGSAPTLNISKLFIKL
jgi:hypothetical protein